MYAPLIEAETNGENYDVSTEDIIARFKQWQKTSSFRIVDVDPASVKIEFDKLPKDVAEFVKEAVEFCPDLIMDDEEAEIPHLIEQLKKTKKFGFWWD